MYLSFMTWVCPDWDLDRIVEFTESSAYDGVELRVDEEHAHGLSSESPDEERARAVELFEDRNVDVAAIATSEFFAHSDPEERADQIAAAKANVELAGDLGADVVRFFAKGDRDEMTDDAAADTAEALTEVGEFARQHDVTPLLEVMHDIVESPEDALLVLERVETANVGLLWNRGEVASADFDEIAERVRHVHTHEEVLDPEFEGITELMSRLDEVGYDGYISLEVIRGEDLSEGLPEEQVRETGERLRNYVENV